MVVLLTLAVIDFRSAVIPNRIVYPAILATACLSLFSPDTNAARALVGGLSLGLFLLIVSLLSKQMGMGDVKLAFLIGLMTGIPEGVIALFSGIFIGGLAAIFLVLSRLKSRKDYIPYGPYLAAGAILTLVLMQFGILKLPGIL